MSKDSLSNETKQMLVLSGVTASPFWGAEVTKEIDSLLAGMTLSQMGNLNRLLKSVLGAALNLDPIEPHVVQIRKAAQTVDQLRNAPSPALLKLVGKFVQLRHGQLLTITSVKKYECREEMTEGFATVTCNDGNDYAVTDRGNLYPFDGAGTESLGNVGSIWN